jgi:hypothetical protein
MVNENLITNNDLVGVLGRTDLKDKILLDKFHILPSELSIIRSNLNLESKVDSAAKLIFNKAKHVVPGRESVQINDYLLAAIIYDSWDKPDSKRASINKFLLKKYRDFKTHSRFKIPPIYFLRDSIDADTGNLLQAEKIYPNFTTSCFDFLRCISLPLELSLQNVHDLGVIWSVGSYRNSNGSHLIELQHKENPSDQDGKLSFSYFDFLAKKLSLMFNLDLSVFGYFVEGNKYKFKDNTYNSSDRTYARIPIRSLAISSWMKFDVKLYDSSGKSSLFMKSDLEDNSLLFKDELYVKSFLAGVIDGAANLTKLTSKNNGSNSFYADLYTKSSSQINTIINIKKVLGYNGNGNKNANDLNKFSSNKKVRISNSLLFDLYQSNLIQNPYHIDTLTNSK